MAEVSPLADKEVALTGRLFSMTRAEAVERILKAGGRHAREPGPTTAILVAGNALGHLTSDGGISRNLEVFQALKKQGASIRLVEEQEFLRLLGAEDDREDFSRLYTAEQVSRIVEAPLSQVRGWVRKGLLQPARLTNRLAWFEFKDILTARNLNRLTASGVPASQIHRSLSEIARWLPDGDRLLGRLEAYATRPAAAAAGRKLGRAQRPAPDGFPGRPWRGGRVAVSRGKPRCGGGGRGGLVRKGR